MTRDRTAPQGVTGAPYRLQRWRRAIRITLATTLIAVSACSGSAPAAVGECVRDSKANVVFGQFPDVVDCPTGDRDFRSRLTDPIFRVVAVAETVPAVESTAACGGGLDYTIWYDDNWAVCGQRL